ncbi:DUF805 domain-containing protein [Microbulbifer sp. SSSA002]|uniref:DUF805 domain-containing protein n=1 Tax=Microbulbifer sp. SSSA002 TaxID=3243376 RepID=UPI00403A0054
MRDQTYLDFYFNPEGTVTRQQFWLLFILPLLLIQTIILFIFQYGNFNFTDGLWKGGEILMTVFGIPLQLGFIWVVLVVCCKRLYSSGLPRRMLIVALPGIGILWLCAELLFAGNKEKNLNQDTPPKPEDTLYKHSDMQ